MLSNQRTSFKTNVPKKSGLTYKSVIPNVEPVRCIALSLRKSDNHDQILGEKQKTSAA